MRSFTQELSAINIKILFLQDYLKTVQYLQQDRLRDYGPTAFQKTECVPSSEHKQLDTTFIRSKEHSKSIQANTQRPIKVHTYHVMSESRAGGTS